MITRRFLGHHILAALFRPAGVAPRPWRSGTAIYRHRTANLMVDDGDRLYLKGAAIGEHPLLLGPLRGTMPPDLWWPVRFTFAGLTFAAPEEPDWFAGELAELIERCG